LAGYLIFNSSFREYETSSFVFEYPRTGWGIIQEGENVSIHTAVNVIRFDLIDKDQKEALTCESEIYDYVIDLALQTSSCEEVVEQTINLDVNANKYQSDSIRLVLPGTFHGVDMGEIQYDFILVLDNEKKVLITDVRFLSSNDYSRQADRIIRSFRFYPD
jgi:hypothetical protein